MKTTDYIIPTKESPVFTAECDYFGFIENNLYKFHLIECPNWDSDSICTTFALYYHDAIVNLHEWLKEHKEYVTKEPKAKFHIRMRDGSWDSKLNQAKETTVYSISAKKAKDLLF